MREWKKTGRTFGQYGKKKEKSVYMSKKEKLARQEAKKRKQDREDKIDSGQHNRKIGNNDETEEN